MLPYSAVAMDYANHYQRHAAVPTTTLSIGPGPTFSHSWLVPPQDLCGMTYKQSAPQQPPLDSGLVFSIEIQFGIQF